MAEFWNPTAIRPKLTRHFGAAPGAGQMSLSPAHTPGESHSQIEGFQAEDRHNPLPHIALSTTALKSAYRNTASLSTRTAAELRKLLIPGGPEWWAPGCSSSSSDVAGLRESVLSRKGSCIPVRLTAGLHAPSAKRLWAG
jgi:hypothetical protein